jgi:hypothetical protein
MPLQLSVKKELVSGESIVSRTVMAALLSPSLPASGETALSTDNRHQVRVRTAKPICMMHGGSDTGLQRLSVLFL